MKEKMEISDYKTKIFFIVKNIMLKTKKTNNRLQEVICNIHNILKTK